MLRTHCLGPGHPLTPDNVMISGKNRYCLKCHNARSREWTAKNPAARSASGKAYYYRNHEKNKARSRAWAAANRKRVREVWRLYYLRKKEDPSAGEMAQLLEIAAKYPRRDYQAL